MRPFRSALLSAQSWQTCLCCLCLQSESLEVLCLGHHFLHSGDTGQHLCCRTGLEVTPIPADQTLLLAFQAELEEVERSMGNRREQLTRIKAQRERLKAAAAGLREASSTLNTPALLGDVEVRGACADRVLLAFSRVALQSGTA